MQAITLKLKPTTIDVEKITSYDELLVNTRQKLHYITECNEHFQRVRYQCKVGMENLKRTIDSYYLLLGKADNYTQQVPEQLTELMQEQRKELDALNVLKESLYQKLIKAMIEYMTDAGACTVDEKI